MTTVGVLRRSPLSPPDAPAWWSPDGEKLRLLHRDHPRHVAGSLLTIGTPETDVAQIWIMSRVGDHRFIIHWHLLHGGKPNGTYGQAKLTGTWLYEMFNSEGLAATRPGIFVRQGRFLNLPEGRTRDDGTDPNLSVYLTDDMIRAVQEVAF